MVPSAANSKGLEDAARRGMACAGDDQADPIRIKTLPAEFARHFAQGFGWTLGAAAGVLAIVMAIRAALP